MKDTATIINNASIAEKARRSHPAVRALYEDGDALYYDHGEHLLRDVAEAPEVRMDTNLFVYCDRGKASLTVNGTPLEGHAQQGFICPSSTRVANISLSADAALLMLCISNEMLTSMLHDKLDAWYRAVYISHIRVLDLSGPDASLAIAFYKDLLHFRARYQDFTYSREVIKLLMQAIITDACSLLVSQTPEPTVHHPASERLFGQFVALLSATDVKHRPVRHYADQLCITAKHLSKVCLQQTSHTAAYWVTEAVKEDIKRALADPRLSNKEVADRLGFGNPSFFGRYVREQFGCTPAGLRQQLSAQHTR